MFPMSPPLSKNFIVFGFSILALTAILGLSKLSFNGADIQDSSRDLLYSKISEEHLDEALVDMDSVERGKLPIHAVIDEKRPNYDDSGVQFYIGNSYALQIKEVPTRENGIAGVAYGPIVRINPSSPDEPPKMISKVRFYKLEEFRKLREH
ncbi:MAG: hypothetical protein EOP04_20475 [Proteobacteria bacterium]|nr:MAG: hypothetical protein EOP04_20475 [Pseudomonadota bacterium]